MSGMRDSRIGRSLYSIETLQRALERAEAAATHRAELTAAWRERAERAEADRDAALDLLREYRLPANRMWTTWEQKVSAFLARVDSGARWNPDAINGRGEVAPQWETGTEPK